MKSPKSTNRGGQESAKSKSDEQTGLLIREESQGRNLSAGRKQKTRRGQKMQSRGGT